MLSGKLNNKTGFQLPDIIVKKAVRIMDHLLKRGLSADTVPKSVSEKAGMKKGTYHP